MGDLDPVTQDFIADTAEYTAEIEEAAATAREFADANEEAKLAVDGLRDSSTETADALGHVRDEAAEAGEGEGHLRDEAIEAGEALGHVRDEALEAAAAERELGDSAEEAAAKLDLMGLAGVSSYTDIIPLVGIIGALVIAAAGVAPAAAAMGLGIGAFAAFAIPTIMKVTGALGDTKAQLAALPAPIREAVSGIKGLEGEFEGISKSFQPQVLSILTQALSFARRILPEIVPLARAGATAVSGLVNTLGTALTSSGFRQFLSMMTSMVVPATQAITRLATTVLRVLGGALEQLAPLSIPFIGLITSIVSALGGPATAVLKVVIGLIVGLGKAIEPLLPGLSALATSLVDDIGSSFQSFLPIITQVVSILGGSLLKILQDLEPVFANALTPNSPFLMALGLIPPVLRVIMPLITGLASLLGNPVLAEAAVWVLSLVTAFRALMVIVALARTGFMLLTAVMEINPFVLILTGIVLLVVAIIEMIRHWHDVESVLDDVRHAFAAAGHDIASVFDEVRHGAAELEHDVAAHFDEIRHDIAQWADDVRHDTDDVITWFRELPGRILAVLAALPGEMLSFGEHIIEGLINGVEAKVGDLLGHIENLGHDISGVFSSVLHMASPSRLFHEHGQNIIQGLINGVQSKVPEMLALMRGLGTGAIGSAQAGSAVGPAGGGTSVHVTVPTQITGQASEMYSSPQFQQYLQAQVQEAVLRYQQVNPSNGLTTTWGRGR